MIWDHLHILSDRHFNQIISWRSELPSKDWFLKPTNSSAHNRHSGKTVYIQPAQYSLFLVDVGEKYEEGGEGLIDRKCPHPLSLKERLNFN